MTGIRVSELIHLKIQDVNLYDGLASPAAMKGGSFPFGGPAKRRWSSIWGVRAQPSAWTG